MEMYEHFSHQHSLTFHENLEVSQLTCTGCKLPCTGTSVYACRPCGFFLHELCFNATRSLDHPLHPKHPLSFFQFPTYTSRSFLCNTCGKIGSGFCFCCTACDFDLHIHCAYPSRENQPLTNTVRIKAHPQHPLWYRHIPSNPDGSCSCDVCGTDSNGPRYTCDICDYDAHIECVNLPETVQREDHPHTLSLLDVNTYDSFECDVCAGAISRKHCMYLCSSECNYGIHVKCVTKKVSDKSPMTDLQVQVELMKIQNKVNMNQMMLNATMFRYHR